MMNIISKGTSGVKLRVLIKDCITDKNVSLDSKIKKIILYLPDGTRLEKRAIIDTEDNKDYISWVDPDFVFDKVGYWGYAGFADIESPTKSIFWVV